MNRDTVADNGKQSKVKVQWGRLADDHLDAIAGQHAQFAGKIQEAYGVGKAGAEPQLRNFGGRTFD